MILASGICSRTPATIFCVGSMHQRSNCSGPSTPAQVSKICTTSAPALSWTDQIFDRALHQPIDQPRKIFRIAIGKQPRRRLVRRCLARHHVGRDRPRRAAKSDQRGLVVERRLDPAHRLIDRRQHLAIDGLAQARQRRGIRQRLQLGSFADLETRPCARAPAAPPEYRKTGSRHRNRNAAPAASVTSAASSGLKQRSRKPPAFSRTARYSGK